MHHSSSHPGPLQSSAAGTRGPIGISGVARSITVPPGAAAAAAGRSPSTGRLSVAAGLAAPPNSSATAAGLRSTLHTDTLAAADRQKLIPERNTQSADVGSSFGLGGTSLTPTGAGGGGGSAPWRIAVPGNSSAGSSGPGTPNSVGSSSGGAGGNGGAGINRTPSITGRNGAAASGAPASTSGGVARILAPNGQPRKVPVALLNQYASQQQQQQVSASQQGVAAWAAGVALGGPKPPAGAAPAQIRSSYSYGLRQ